MMRGVKYTEEYINNIIGQRFGEKTIIGYCGYKNHEHCFEYCCDCGDIKQILLRHIKNKSCEIKNKIRSCGKCFNDFSASTKKIFSTYKNQAKRRNYLFELSLKDVEDLIYNSCYYCDVEPNNILKNYNNTTTKYSGIDRIDNNVGYIKTNCVSCCRQCNTAKLNYTTEEFYSWIERIANKHGRNI